ncbi:hypothetical protein BD626DRAFT_473420 [Schizophyllum amplum]|uniref:BTB domain-containing protein n=1 Tax=Schizophyllum amplum TaxID=97359 RepID=A0A550CWS3_9AGAR|nr:hypothetical protein BD626DRAFT_473420 [Auriculariopsis ampla]
MAKRPSLSQASRWMISARSSFFRDLFSVPQPPGAPLSDGCLLIELPDKAAEVAHFLRAIFDSGSFEKPSNSEPCTVPVRRIAAVLRLAHKYDVSYLRRRALLHASIIYPRSYEIAKHTAGFTPPITTLSLTLVRRSALNGCSPSPMSAARASVLKLSSTAVPIATTVRATSSPRRPSANAYWPFALSSGVQTNASQRCFCRRMLLVSIRPYATQRATPSPLPCSRKRPQLCTICLASYGFRCVRRSARRAIAPWDELDKRREEDIGTD